MPVIPSRFERLERRAPAHEAEQSIEYLRDLTFELAKLARGHFPSLADRLDQAYCEAVRLQAETDRR